MMSALLDEMDRCSVSERLKKQEDMKERAKLKIEASGFLNVFGIFLALVMQIIRVRRCGI